MSTIHEYVERALALQPLLERRKAARFPCESVTCGYHALTLEDVPASAGSVRDSSAHGLCLNLSHPVEPGNVLAVELRAPDGQDLPTILLRVAHADALKAGRWAVGGPMVCEFSGEELGHLRIQPT